MQIRISNVVIAISMIVIPLTGQTLPTPHQKEVFGNVEKVETTIALDKAEYLPGEFARITCTVRNPTASPLEIPAPFQWTGRWEMGPTVPIPPEMAQYVGGVLHADTPHRYWDVPTIVLAPGQAITKTQTTMESSRWVTFTIPYEPGEYGLVYTFDDRAHAAFKVLQPLKATAIAAVALPPVEIADIRTNHQRVMHSGTAILLVVEISPQDYRLVRAAMFRDISGHLNPNNPASFLRELYGYETVGTFGEEVTSLKASMANGDTVDVTAITASQREIHMNVPAQPAKTASTEKQ